MSDAKDTTIALNVCLKASDPLPHPLATTYTNVGVTQGIAYSGLRLHRADAAGRDRQHGEGRASDIKRLGGPSRYPRGNGRGCACGCSSRYSKCWSARARHNSRSRKRRVEGCVVKCT
jgi:hypothetical protein